MGPASLCPEANITNRITRSLSACLLALLVSGIVGMGASGTGPGPGTFVRTGDMTAARSQHSATLLFSGQVLLAGGSGGLATAEIYEPAAGRFREAGAMTLARRLHSATLLPDGRVLIAGGYGEADALASAEIFDPVTGTFSTTGSMRTARGFHSANLLSTGEVLVTGGYGWRAYPNVAPAELYDPITGVFRAAGEYVGRGGCDFCAPSVLLHDGTVLFTAQTPSQLYDPANNAFTPNGVMTFELSAAAALDSGHVLFAGGEVMARMANAELYDPVNRTFTRVGDMASRRVWHTLTALPNGTALAAGGETEGCSGNSCVFAGSLSSSELYVPLTRTFVPTGSMAFARETHTATLLGDGRVLMAGGVSYGGIGIYHGGLASAELYTPEALMPTPTLVSLSEDGGGQGAIYHAGTRHPATRDDPAAADEDVDIHCSGLSAGMLPRVAIAGRLAAVVSSTHAVEGASATVLRVRVPRGIAAGPAVSVRLLHMDRPSNEVTIAVR
jgi:hypothetical protein